jgi:hypothetical protein
MATQQQGNAEFQQFVNYMGVQLTSANLHMYSDLYGNFAGWCPPITCNSFAKKFIQWKRFYDEYNETQQQIVNTNLFNTQLPNDLQQLNNNQGTNFQHFIMQNEPQQTQTHNCSPCSTEPPKDAQNLSSIMNNDEIVENQILEVLEQSQLYTPPLQSTPQTPSSIEANPPTPQKSILQNPSPPTSSHHGKNIQQMKEFYDSQKKSESKPAKRQLPENENKGKMMICCCPRTRSTNKERVFTS